MYVHWFRVGGVIEGAFMLCQLDGVRVGGGWVGGGVENDVNSFCYAHRMQASLQALCQAILHPG